MKINVNYFENVLKLDDDKVMCIEIENKNYFYRFIRDLNFISYGLECDDILFFDVDTEINLNGRIKILIDYFDLKFNDKKLTNNIVKYINKNIDEKGKFNLSQEYSKIVKIYKSILNELDIPLIIDDTLNLDLMTKYLKIDLCKQEQLLDNLLLLLDLEKTLNDNDFLVFVNLKQYLTKFELLELYKYAVYNKIKILLVDSQSYGVTLNFEKKLIIDENLDEFVL